MKKPPVEERAWELLRFYTEQSMEKVGCVSPIIFIWTPAGIIPLRETDPTDAFKMECFVTLAQLLARAYRTLVVGIAAETTVPINAVLCSSGASVSENGFLRCVSLEIQTVDQQRTADFGINLDTNGKFRGLEKLVLDRGTAGKFARILPLHRVSDLERKNAMRTAKKLGAVQERWFPTGPEFGNS